MNKEFKPENNISFEEAKELFNKEISDVYGDVFVSYASYEDEKEEEDNTSTLLNIKTEADLIKEEFEVNRVTVLATGDKCTKFNVDDVVIIDPMMFNTIRPIFIGKVQYTLFPERAVICKVKN